MSSVAIIGTVAFDSIETPFGKKERILGGSATFSGIAASLFSPVSLISIVGRDFPQEHFDFFKSKQINVDGISVTPGKTFHWKGYYKGDMNQAFTVSTELNVLEKFDPLVPKTAQSSAIVFLANIDPALQKKALTQFKSANLVILDTMNFWIEHRLAELKETLRLADILIVNDQEIRQLTGKTNVIQAMAEILNLGPKRVILKKGEHGSMMHNGKQIFICPAVPLTHVTDPTGAGDSFAGGFAGYLAQYSSLEDEEIFKKAMLAGTLISSVTVQNFSIDALKTLTPFEFKQKFLEFRKFFTPPETL